MTNDCSTQCGTEQFYPAGLMHNIPRPSLTSTSRLAALYQYLLDGSTQQYYTSFSTSWHFLSQFCSKCTGMIWVLLAVCGQSWPLPVIGDTETNKQTNKHVQPKTEPRRLLICTPFVLEAVVTSKSGHVCDVCIVFRRSMECTFSPQLVTSTSGHFKYLCVPAAVMPGISHQLFVSIMLH